MRNKNGRRYPGRVLSKQKGNGTYKNWKEFAASLDKKGFPREIIALARQVHDHCVKKYGPPNHRISYTQSDVISFKTPRRLPRGKTVFAFMQIQKREIKLFLTLDGSGPASISMKVNKNDPKERIIALRNAGDFIPTIKNLIWRSHKLVIGP